MGFEEVTVLSAVAALALAVGIWWLVGRMLHRGRLLRLLVIAAPFIIYVVGVSVLALVIHSDTHSWLGEPHPVSRLEWLAYVHFLVGLMCYPFILGYGVAALAIWLMRGLPAGREVATRHERPARHG